MTLLYLKFACPSVTTIYNFSINFVLVRGGGWGGVGWGWGWGWSGVGGGVGLGVGVGGGGGVVGVLCSKLNFYPYNFCKRGLKILNYKLQILIFGNTYSPLKFDGGECGEYGLVLWASWLSTEPPNEDVGPQWPLTGRASPVSPSKCLEWKETSSVFQLLSPGKVLKKPLETRLEAILVKPS